MEYAVIVFVALLTGYVLCYVSMRSSESPSNGTTETIVKRVRGSMRSPLRTTKTEYDKYKANGSELYSPVKPTGKKEDIEVGR